MNYTIDLHEVTDKQAAEAQMTGFEQRTLFSPDIISRGLALSVGKPVNIRVGTDIWIPAANIGKPDYTLQFGKYTFRSQHVSIAHSTHLSG